MATEPESVSLREYLERRIDDNDRRYEQRFAAQEDAIGKAESATEKRFESVNEFRQSLSDQTAGFLPRLEAASIEKSNADKVASLQSRLDKLEGKGSGVSAFWLVLVGAAGMIGALFGIWKAVGGH